MTPPSLSADQLCLTAPTMDDAVDWAEAQDDECARWFDWPCRPSVDRCRDYLRVVTTETDLHSYTWAIRSPDGFAGGIDLKCEGSQWNVSYFVHPEHRGRHVARRALQAVTEWAFAERGLDAISTRVHVENIASQKVLQAAGFSRIRTEGNPDADHQDFIYELRT